MKGYDVQENYEICVNQIQRLIGAELNLIEKVWLRRKIVDSLKYVESPADFHQNALDSFFEEFFGLPFVGYIVYRRRGSLNLLSRSPEIEDLRERVRQGYREKIELMRQEDYML
ncbi:hypothetical protein CL618_01375 [archaeon]|nr:hypothetical protein [archaeon]|tara:strand:- start:2542 stop:2883 length:342 start_codon:yes stop_codon:yes gene_type:complete